MACYLLKNAKPIFRRTSGKGAQPSAECPGDAPKMAIPFKRKCQSAAEAFCYCMISSLVGVINKEIRHVLMGESISNAVAMTTKITLDHPATKGRRLSIVETERKKNFPFSGAEKKRDFFV